MSKRTKPKTKVISEIKEQSDKKPLSLKKRIGNLDDIIRFINKLTTKNIQIVTELDKSFDYYTSNLDEPSKMQFYELLYADEIYIRSKHIFPIQVKLKGIAGSEVQLKLIEGISVVQELQDNAQEKGLLDGSKRYDIISLKGALDEFCYMVEPMDNEMLINSKDKTHLRKTAMGVYINASKLISLESKIYGKDPHKVFSDEITKLPPEVQEEIIREYILTEFNPSWIPYFSDDLIQRCLEQMIMNPEIKAKIDSTILLHLFQKLFKPERLDFLRLLANNLDGTELNILKGITKQL